MEKITVPNKYERDSFLKLQFQWRGSTCRIKSAPYRLVVVTAEGEELLSVKADSYFDCAAFSGDMIFWGERMGKLFATDLSDASVHLSTFLSEEAETLYMEMSGKYPGVFPPNRSDFPTMEEISAMNIVTSSLAVSVLTVYKNYLIAGDLSGRVSVFEAKSLTPIKAFRVDGAVTGITAEGGRIAVCFAEVKNVPSPHYLTRYDEVARVYFDLNEV